MLPCARVSIPLRYFITHYGITSTPCCKVGAINVSLLHIASIFTETYPEDGGGYQIYRGKFLPPSSW
jgi:hypothetical protein